MTARLLHVLGGGPWQVPTVRLAKAMGHRVLVTDIYEQRPAYALADRHEVIDITDLDRTLAAARRHGIDGILCDTTDTGVPCAAFVAERLGLPGIGFETALNFTDKARMRAVTHHAGVPAGPHRLVRAEGELAAAAAHVGLPLVVKPVGNQAGRGVSIVRDLSRLQDAWRLAARHARGGPVLLDGFLEGTEYIVDGFVVGGTVTILGIASKLPYRGNPTVCSRILYLSGKDFDAMHERVESVNRTVIGALGLRDGIFHAEYIVSPDRAVPIDVAARGGGVMIYPRVLPYVSGVDAMRAMIDRAMGDPVVIEPLPVRRGASIDFLRMPTGTLRAVSGVAEAQAIAGVIALHFNAKPGDVIGTPLHKDERPGFVVAVAPTSAEALRIGRLAKGTIRARTYDHPAAVPSAREEDCTR